MTTKVYFIFFLATAIYCESASFLRAVLRRDRRLNRPLGRSVNGRWQRFRRARPETTVVVSGARLSSQVWEIRGFAALPRDRCASSFSHSSGRKHFYIGSNSNCCRLNLFHEQGRVTSLREYREAGRFSELESFAD